MESAGTQTCDEGSATEDGNMFAAFPPAAMSQKKSAFVKFCLLGSRSAEALAVEGQH
jgi:hypothetical protein